MEPGTTAVIPAAGRSSRMGVFKPLLPFEATTLIERAIANAEHGCDEVIVVAGYRGAELIDHLALNKRSEPRPQLRVVLNHDWERGMLSSIQRGAREVRTEYFFVSPADMPYLTPEIYTELARNPPRYAAFPEHKGRRGHPVLISSSLIPALLEADPEAYGSMRRFLAEYATETRTVAGDEILIDLDTLEQYHGAQP